MRRGSLSSRRRSVPKIVEREYLEKFPGWSRVEVTTGWLRASVDGQTVSDAPHRNRSRALLGSLPAGGAAEDLRQRDEGDRQPSDAGQAAVPSRSRHRGVDERARLPDRRRRRADIVDRVAARGSVLRHARFLRRARPDDDAAAAGRARQDLPDHASVARGQAGRSSHPLRRQRVGDGAARIHLPGKRGREAGARHASADEDRHDGAGGASRGRAIRPRLGDRAARRREGRPRGDSRRRRPRQSRAPARRRPLQDRAVLRPRRPRRGERRAQGRAGDGASSSRPAARRRPTCVARRGRRQRGRS